MMARILPRVRPLSSTALALALAVSAACSSGSASAPWEVVSPSTQNVVVPPGQSVRFEIRAGNRLDLRRARLRESGGSQCCEQV